MIFIPSYSKYLYKIIFFILFGNLVFAQAAKDIVNGNLIQFNDNGLWCWYQDERAIVDVANGKLIVGSDASSQGVGYSTRNGSIEAVIFDLQSGLLDRYQ